MSQELVLEGEGTAVLLIPRSEVVQAEFKGKGWVTLKLHGGAVTMLKPIEFERFKIIARFKLGLSDDDELVVTAERRIRVTAQRDWARVRNHALVDVRSASAIRPDQPPPDRHDPDIARALSQYDTGEDAEPRTKRTKR